MATTPPSPNLTAVSDDLTHISEQELTGRQSEKHPADIEPGLAASSTTNPVPFPTLDPDAKSGKEHVQLEHSNPSLYAALEKNNVYLTHRDEHGNYLVRSTKNDAKNPRNWGKVKRYGVVGLASWLNILVCLCASGYSTGVGEIEDRFSVSSEIGTLGLSLYLLGFATGPMTVAPLSEFFGRKPVYLVSWAIFTIFQIPLAIPPNIATVLVCRYIQGFAGSAPLANTGGVVHDCFDVVEGGYAVGIYTLSSVIGPPVGNALCGFFTQNVGEFDLFWFFLGLFGFHWFVILFLLPETRDTIIMTRKASTLRKETGIENIYAEHELDKKAPSYLWKTALVRPFVFLSSEPLTYLSAGINGFAYGMIFLSNEAFPLVFGTGNNGHNWTHSGVVNLTFLAYVVGGFLGFLSQPLQEHAYHRISRRLGYPSPEGRWWSALWATFFLPLGLFIAAWTSYGHIPFIAPLIGFACFGFGFYHIIGAILNGIVDSYGHYAASALGGVVFVRNIVGAAFPLFASQMFKKLGNQWALCLLAFLSCFLLPIPFLLYYKGKTIRAKSPYCATHFGH
ncbi:hypothetical protein NCC49_006024 [Naganishia albida]|nr:hypothetical protein NCC49_006024 [Naganishia albida]